MISTKDCFILRVLFLGYLLHMSDALQCKICQKNDPACLLAEDVEIHNCVNDNDLCYSWFERSGSNIGVQRGCMPTDIPEYRMIKKLIGHKNSECLKRVNGLDCFTFCSLDKCN